MSQPFIVLGDKTDHGGVVIEAAASTDTGGVRIARVGDRSPACKADTARPSS